MNQLTGQRFGRLIVLGIGGKQRGNILWKCQCDCGEQRLVRGSHLKNNETLSCGCYGLERHTQATTKHGHAANGTCSPEYRSWSSMITRCYNPKTPKFHLYGGAGIVVCDAWRASFETFLKDVGQRPRGTTLDRHPNRSGNYEPGNVRWATLEQQNNNKADNIIVNFRGLEMTFSQAVHLAGTTSIGVAFKRRKLGWPLNEILETPTRTEKGPRRARSMA